MADANIIDFPPVDTSQEQNGIREHVAASLAGYPDVLTLSEVSEILRVKRDAIMAMVSRGELIAFHACKNSPWRFPKSGIVNALCCGR